MKTDDFDPNGVGVNNGNYFGLPFGEDEAELVLVSVPWDVTVSYGAGTVYGPDAVIDASTQLDLYDETAPGLWRRGIASAPVDYDLHEESQRMREDAERIISRLEEGGDVSGEYYARKLRRVNDACRRMNDSVYRQVAERIDAGHRVGMVGGDHSTSYGAIRAVAERYPDAGVLHLDAHCDLREAYEGFEFSHASVMFNVLRDTPLRRLVQVGVRDYCDSEAEMISEDARIEAFTWHSLVRNRFMGMTWHEQCRRIVEKLPDRVYVSFDIDALSMEYCPHTGTPVTGGLSFDEAVYLMECVVESGREIVGFDMVEVAPKMDDRTDAIVGARILYKLCLLTLKSKKQ